VGGAGGGAVGGREGRVRPMNAGTQQLEAQRGPAQPCMAAQAGLAPIPAPRASKGSPAVGKRPPQAAGLPAW
jgi:hypothetical protein